MISKMKVAGAAAVLALALGLSVTAKAQDPGQQPQQQQQQPDAQQGQRQDSQAFTGTIVKMNDKYVLQDKASTTTYQIDDQDKAKQWENKRVRVVGTLDPTTNVIHVTSISEARG